MTSQERQLIEFARKALGIIKEDEQWAGKPSDTIDFIKKTAMAVGIAEVKNNFFHIKKEFQS